MLDETPAEEVVEKEINLVQAEQANPEANILTETPKTNFVSKKPIADLSDADKATIIANHQNGINQPFYDVKQFKNGKYRILKKKESQPTVAQKAINEAPPPTKAEKKVYYSDNQLLFEHIIEDESENVGVSLDQNETKIDKTEPDIVPTKPTYQTVYPQATKRGWRSQVTFL